MLFVGATGKSAQIPLYVWLPDAMEGPTPVSALIHAATMVTAGVYMVARMNAIYQLAPIAMDVVAFIGATTAIFAASMALVQTDIKKVLAYSTISQLGYMFLALGVGAFAAGIFHLMTHAFFKALLFLGAGSVIHSLSGEQDIRKMGGLWNSIPATSRPFLIATLAIAGIFPFAGFFSKDEILGHAFHRSQMMDRYLFLWLVGLITAGMTAYYMFRLLFLTFFGLSRVSPELEEHIHESPKTMTVPLMILAFLSISGGWFALPVLWGEKNTFGIFLEPVLGGVETETGAVQLGQHTLFKEYFLMILSLAVVGLGLWVAYQLFLKNPKLHEKIADSWPRLHNLSCPQVLCRRNLRCVVCESHQGSQYGAWLGGCPHHRWSRSGRSQLAYALLLANIHLVGQVDRRRDRQSYRQTHGGPECARSHVPDRCVFFLRHVDTRWRRDFAGLLRPSHAGLVAQFALKG